MSEWKNVALGDFGSFTNGINKDKNAFGKGVPFVNLLDIYGKESMSREPAGLVQVTENEIRNYDLKKGDILFARSSVKPEGVGQTCVVLRNFDRIVYSGFIIRYRQFDQKIWYQYAKYCFDNPIVRRSVLAKSTVSANTNINQESLKTITVPLPPLPHQRKIARILTTVDNIIEKTEAAIAKYKAIKQGMMHDLFTRGIDVKTGKLRPKFEDAPELYKESELGWIPKEWEEYKFDDILVEYLDFRGKTPKKLGMDWGNGEIRALSANNVHDGQIDFSKECYFGSIELYNKWMNKGDCKKGDVVMTMEAPLGNLAQIPDDKKYILSQRTILFKTREHLVFNDFLYYLLSFDLFQVELCKNSTGSTVTGIQQKKLAKILIALPKQISEQKLISDSINSANNRIKNEELFLSKYKELKSGLMQDLLTGKKEVAPDPEDYANDGEPV